MLARIDAERAHGIGLWCLRRIPFPAVRVAAGLRVDVFGRTHPTPLGVAAGLDKYATAFCKLHKLGFGHVEIGTVTPEPQPGNPRPRVFRVINRRALVNRMGFPSPGSAAVGRALSRRHDMHVVGVNVGKNREGGTEDFAIATADLAGAADFVVVNVSSPNTPGLRDLQAIEPLRGILEAVTEQAGDRPVLVKISPDLADEDIDAITDLAVSMRLAGIVCTNTTIDHSDLRTSERYEGGVSGAPLAPRAVDVLARVYRRAGEHLVLISVGGVMDATDVWERLRMGATLVQAYTGFVYGGPLWPRRVNRDLAKLLNASGFDSIASVVGSGVVD